TSVSPSSALAGSPGFTISVFGSGFTPGMSIVWNGTQLSTTYISSTQLQAYIDTFRLASPGTFPITVTGTSGTVNFTVGGTTMPTLTSVSPSSIPAGSGST